MEASYATELQCAGQDKRDTVECEVVYWVLVAKDSGQGGRGGRVHVNRTYTFNKW
jgi:hypothetical protein